MKEGGPESRVIESALARTGRVSTSVVIVEHGARSRPRTLAFVVPAHRELETLPPGNRWLSPSRFELAVQSPTEAAYFHREIFERECYLGDGVTLDDVEVVFDVGANVGMFSLFVASRRPEARIYAVEPAPPLFRLLERNVRAHGIDARLFHCALAARPGRGVLTFYPRSSGMSSLEADPEEESEILRRHVEVAGKAGQEGMDRLMDQLEGFVASRLVRQEIPVPVRTLSELFDEAGVERVDLLKIDVQKSELQVLEGIRDEHWRRVRQVALEVHDICGRLEILRALLACRGFEVAVRQDEDLVGTVLYNVYGVSRRAPVGAPSEAGTAGRPTEPSAVDDPALVAELERGLERELPPAMMPSRIVVLRRLPRTPTGELDREALVRCARSAG